MKIILAQVKYILGDFEFNFKQVTDNLIKSDLIIFPSLNVCEAWQNDDVFLNAKKEFYKNIKQKVEEQAVLIGNVFINNGEIIEVNDGFVELNSKKIYISDKFTENVDCDLYVLPKNRYFSIDNSDEFIEGIAVNTNFVYVNSIALIDENVYAGESFAKNSENELVLKMPVCEKKVSLVDFSKPQKFENEAKEALIEKILTFALREYCEIIGFKKVILGLSGGIDSALTAILATKALGAANVLGILLPSMYSSKGSIDDSLELSKNLGIKTEKIPITPMFEKFMTQFDKKSDFAEENLQSRLRGLILMFLSNREDYLLLSTGNKSEIAVGYGTLYGDMAGGFNLLADLTKTKVYKLANWINREKNVIPQQIIEKAPSAELRPNQKDSDSLPEYDILDGIIEAVFEQKKQIDEVYKDFDKMIVDDVIKRVYLAQFKRNQACLGVRLTDNAFCSNLKLPITQRLY